MHPTNQEIPIKYLPDFKSIPPLPSMIESVAAHGILDPIIVKKVGRNQFEVVAGRRRIQAARAANLQSVPARVYDSDWDEDLVTALISNEQRSENPLVELETVEMLLADGYDEEWIRKASGMSYGKLKRLMQIQQLLPEIRVALEKGQVKISVAEQIAKLTEGQQRRLIRTLGNKGKIVSKDVSELKRVKKNEEVAKLPFEIFDTKPHWSGVARQRLYDLRGAIEKDATPRFLKIIDKAIAELGD